MFESGLQYVRADFHLHTLKDKEFTYSGESTSFVGDYVSALKNASINVGIITNHNKFDIEEYKAIRKAAKKQDIFILPGVELTVKEGANGIHTLIVFNPEEWLKNGNNHIQTFLTAAFATISNPENRNTKSIFDLKNVFDQLDAYGRDYFIFIDQPEDDLDNKVIYDEVITAIAQKKPYMQFIFATHNANIPVLGDSERVLVVEFQESRIDVAQGNIDLDSTHKQIVDIMEGGKEAFDKRQLIYTSWR